MKNFKILENRSELTKEQLTQGMDFNKVKIKAKLAKTAILKAFILKCILGAVVIGSIVLVCKLTMNKVSGKNSINFENEKILRTTNLISGTFIDTSNRTKVVTKNSNLIITKKEGLSFNGKLKTDSTSNTQNTFNFYKPKRCVILLPSHCCYCIPVTHKLATSVDSADIKFDYFDCESIYHNQDVSCIWLTITTKENSYLKLENQLENFALLKGNGKVIHPYMIKVTSNPKLMGSDFKGKTIIVHYNKQLDVLLFFKNADPQVGGKIRINKRIATINPTDNISQKNN